jgi:nucleoside-diphosphate-sugar epimerase
VLPEGSTIVVTGVTGQVGGPVAVALAAAGHRVVGAARFRDEAARTRLEAAGVHCAVIDLAAGDVEALPADADFVCHFAVAKSNKWALDLDANVGGLGTLMEHHRAARAFLHCSTTAVYKAMGHHVFSEDDELGDNHGVWPFLRTYSISKIAAEAMARWAARRFALPTTIARLSVPYGDGGGWPAVHLEMMRNGTPIPVHVDAPSIYHPLHEDDIVRSVPGLLAGASVPATVVNWGGDAAVSIEEWCGYLSELTGLAVEFAPTDQTIDSVDVDLTRLHELVGPSTVDWRDGLRRMVTARHPQLVR